MPLLHELRDAYTTLVTVPFAACFACVAVLTALVSSSRDEAAQVCASVLRLGAWFVFFGFLLGMIAGATPLPGFIIVAPRGARAAFVINPFMGLKVAGASYAISNLTIIPIIVSLKHIKGFRMTGAQAWLTLFVSASFLWVTFWPLVLTRLWEIPLWLSIVLSIIVAVVAYFLGLAIASPVIRKSNH